MAKLRASFILPTHDFRAVNGADIVRRIRIADGVEDPPAYYGVHGLEHAQEQAEAVGLTSLWYRGRVWRREVAAGGELIWLTDGGPPTPSDRPVALQQQSLIGAWA